MRKTTLFAILLCLGCASATYAAQKQVVITLDEKPVTLKQEVVYENDRMMLPVRDMANVLHANITYDTDTRTAIVEKRMATVWDTNQQPLVWKVSMGLDSEYLKLLDRHELLLDAKPLIVKDRAYLPFRALAEAMNLEVVWHTDGNTDYVDLKSTHLPNVQLTQKDEFDRENMSILLEWQNNETEGFYATEGFALEKWNGKTWEIVAPDEPFTPNTDTYGIPTGGPTDGKREKKLTLWQWEKSMPRGKYRVVVPYHYEQGDGEQKDFFTLDSSPAFEKGTQTTYVAYCEFLVK